MPYQYINTSFEALLEQVEDAVGELNRRGAKSLQFGDYEGARNLMQDAEGITFFRHRVRELQSEWQALFGDSENGVERDANAPLPRGLRTKEDIFRLPILASVEELGGKSSVEAIMEKVEIKLETVINDYDCESLPADPKVLRWKNTAFWCGNTMANEELLNNDAQNGLWELTEKGREYLAEMKAALGDTEAALASNTTETGSNSSESDSAKAPDAVEEKTEAAAQPELMELKLPKKATRQHTVKRIS